MIECNKIKTEGKPATHVKLAVNALTNTELANALEATLLALLNTDETRRGDKRRKGPKDAKKEQHQHQQRNAGEQAEEL